MKKEKLAPVIKFQQPFAFLLIMAVGFVVFANVLAGDFIFDDKNLIVNNLWIQSTDNLSKIFTTDINQGASIQSQFYRPLQTLIYMAIFHLFGLNPIAFHCSVLLLHIGNSIWVFKLLNLFRVSYGFCLLGSIFFLLHPVQLEAVSYISGLADPLGLFFCLFGIWLYGRYLENSISMNRGGLALTIMVLYFLALLSKEQTLIFPGLLWAYDVHKSRLTPWISFLKARIIFYFPLICVALGYLYFREQILPISAQGLWREANLYTDSLSVRLLSFFGALWEYAKLLGWPIHLFYEKPLTYFSSMVHGPVIFGISLAFLWLVLGILQTLRTRRNLLLFSFLWVFVSFLPVAGIIPANAVYLEHWLYFPMVGITVLLFCAVSLAHQKVPSVLLKKVLVLGIVLILGLYALRDMQRNREWSDPVKFYENELFYAPHSLRMSHNLAFAYYEAGKIDQAIQFYQNAIARGDAYPQSHHNLANALLKNQKINEAIVEYYRTLQMDPNFLYSHGMLKQIYQQLNLPERAALHGNFEEEIRAGRKITFAEINVGLGLPADSVPE